MKIFVWEIVSECTDNYHPEGGVVVVAESLEEAVSMANARNCKISEDEHPDLVLDVEPTAEKQIFIMPDAGCC